MSESAEAENKQGSGGGSEEANHGLGHTEEMGSSQAVTKEENVDGGEAPILTVEKTKEPDRRRSKSGKRRSGFSRGRISLTQLSKEASESDADSVGAELYKQIPAELPAAERLSLLSRLILRHTLEVLDKEFEDVPGFDNFKAEAVMSVGTTIDQMESDGSFQQACTTPSLASNPVNLQMENTIYALTSCIKRLEKEDADWNELVTKLESQAQGAKEQVNQLDVQYSDIPEDIKELSSTFLPQPADLPDLSAICSDTVRDVKTISLLMDDYCHSVGLLNTTHKAAANHVHTITKALDEAVSCNWSDPKESIQQLLAS